MVDKKFLVVDLETSSLDIATCDLIIFGAYSIQEDKYYIWKYDNKNSELRLSIQKLLDSYNFILTYNGEMFDFPILERYGFRVNYAKHIDLLKVVKWKRPTMIAPWREITSFTLKNIIKDLKIDEVGKLDIDYNIFKKDKWNDDEKIKVLDYVKQDLKLTAKLWIYLEKRFDAFKEYLNDKDKARYIHVTSSLGTYVYKVICNLANIEELYNSNATKIHYEGGYVSSPKVEEARGNIICVDYTSLYPNVMLQANLFSHSCGCCLKDQKWHGGEFWSVEGFYCKKNVGKIEKLIKKFLILKEESKNTKDQHRDAYKLILNTLYGVSANPVFHSLYNLITASDCTSLARQTIKKSRELLTKEKYDCLYTDTDSIYIQIPEGKSMQDCINDCNKITLYLSTKFPFPSELFNLKVEYKIKYIQFFKDESGRHSLKKKNYLFVYTDKDGKDEIKIKGLDIIQKDCSALSKLIYKKYLREEIIKNLDCKFDKLYIAELIMKELKNNIDIIAKPFVIGEPQDYISKTSLQYLILQRYGSGEMKLIRNYRVGAGKGVKYCSLEEAKNLTLKDIDIESALKELEPFTKDVDVRAFQQKTLFETPVEEVDESDSI